ncbi:phosphate/phosphite/phosphonate ABC transporter substrate-binding protein [Herbaspirillum rhizosphaerae]|uniref:phosphate/phosphite/phosphonate ABC transporter substrate-binding protein n=1 Tax=Herbaspirillum rhizosphaerae TaxID=346179 RepID=UPI00067D45C5|nr:phosphate/phosphite/phosphonate ABC transporter substrate-binding protein [Herbaspirillum rhizosphaerae]
MTTTVKTKNAGRRRRLLSRLSGALAMSLALAATSTAAECERPARLRISFVPQGELQDDGAAMKPLFEDLEHALRMPVEIITPASYGAVTEGLLAGAVDIARLGPATYVSVRKSDPHITPFATLVRMNDGFSEANASSYYSILIVRQHGPVSSIAGLKGKRLALADPESTSGALIPIHVFSRQLGTSLDKYFQRIGYSGNHEQSVAAVLNKEVDAAFVASSNLGALIAAGKVKRSDIRVLWKSAPIPFDPFVYRGQLCEDIKKKIRNVFFNKKSANMQSTLNAIHAQEFVAADDKNYNIIRNLP